MENTENVIEFISGQHYATLSLTNGKHIRRMKKLYEERKDEFKYFVENPDGSVCCKIPLKWVKINPGAKPDAPKRTISPEQREKMLAALAKARENR